MANWGTKQDGAGDHRWDLSPGALSMEGTLRPRYRKLTPRQRTPEFQPYSHYPPCPLSPSHVKGGTSAISVFTPRFEGPSHLSP